MAIQLLAAPLLFAGRIAVGAARAGLRAGLRGGLNRGAVANAVSGSMSLTVTSNLPAFAKAVDAFGKNQMPFAYQVAINDTAKDVRGQIIERSWPSDVNVRNKRFMQTALTPISKRNPDVFATKKNLRAIVGNTRPRMQRDYLQRLTQGGVKTPRGKHLAIPSNQNTLSRTAGGAVRKADRPRQLLNRKGVFIQKLVKSGDMAIMRRVGKDRYPVQMLYLLEPSGQIKKQFSFYEDANATARRAFRRNFERAFKRAKATAKRKGSSRR